jgi:glycogen synthase
MANIKEPYSADCARKMNHLKSKYPNCIWADPNYFFTDGSVVNRGSDYGLMPSIFEPGGIVQHEFFVGGTPVIAYKTGGLKDSVFEFMWDSE